MCSMFGHFYTLRNIEQAAWSMFKVEHVISIVFAAWRIIIRLMEICMSNVKHIIGIVMQPEELSSGWWRYVQCETYYWHSYAAGIVLWLMEICSMWNILLAKLWSLNNHPQADEDIFNMKHIIDLGVVPVHIPQIGSMSFKIKHISKFFTKYMNI
jgi:hypothetical protein